VYFFKTGLAQVAKSSLCLSASSNVTVRIDFVITASVARWYVFKPNVQIWVNFGRTCNGRSWYFLRPFCLVSGQMVYFMAILWSFGIFLQFRYVVPRKIWQPWWRVIEANPYMYIRYTTQNIKLVKSDACLRVTQISVENVHKQRIERSRDLESREIKSRQGTVRSVYKEKLFVASRVVHLHTPNITEE
jgi:hypothetical protein